MNTKHSVAVIGAGPAGISAAVQLCRAGFSVILFEGDRPGGLIRNAWRVENVAVLNPMPGAWVADRLAERLAGSGARLVPVVVDTVHYDSEGDRFVLYAGQECYFGHSLILASGTKPCPWPLWSDMDPALHRHVHRHVAGLDAAGKSWAVIGGGDAAFDYSLSLADGGGQVHLFCRSDRIPALKRLQNELARRNSVIRLRLKTGLTAVQPGRHKPLALTLNGPGAEQVIEVDGLLPAIGRVPADDCLRDDLRDRLPDLQRQGRFFAIGDVRGGGRRQLSIALGQGIDAAMAIEEARLRAKEE